MSIKKWYWILAAICIIVFAMILLTGIGERAGSNMFFSSLGSFSPFPQENISTEHGMRGNITRAVDLRPQNKKLMDGDILISEWNRSSPTRPQRNITIIHVTDDDFKDYPDLQRGMHLAKDTLPNGDSGWSMSIYGFNTNQSDYDRFMNAVCRNKTRIECYADLPAFEYDGRHYFIDIATF